MKIAASERVYMYVNKCCGGKKSIMPMITAKGTHGWETPTFSRPPAVRL